jgi:hypothetical protein
MGSYGVGRISLRGNRASVVWTDPEQHLHADVAEGE